MWVIFRELALPLLSFSELQKSPSSAPLAADGGIVMNFCHLIFHEQPLERSNQTLLSLQHAFKVLDAGMRGAVKCCSRAISSPVLEFS